MYRSEECRQLLATAEIWPSMTEKYDPCQNVVVEGVSGILQDEFVLNRGVARHAHQLEALEVVAGLECVYYNYIPCLLCHYLNPEQMCKYPIFRTV